MRFVDIDEVVLPDGWLAHANEALTGRRAEIVEAEAEALATGQDPAAARKAAITAGLRVPARQRIWQDLNPRLGVITKGKCWYSESSNPTADKNVDHFGPRIAWKKTLRMKAIGGLPLSCKTIVIQVNGATNVALMM